MEAYRFMVRGARGTMPACGEQFNRYGGNTTCYSLETPTGCIMIDAGTGIRYLANDILAGNSKPLLTLFFTHFHMDHVIGLPGFAPFYSKDTDLTIYADATRPEDWKETLARFIHKPMWPIGLLETEAGLELRDLPTNTNSLEVHGVTISWMKVPHPQQSLSYKMDIHGTKIVVATDVEYREDNLKLEFLEFCRDVDILLFDTQYTSAEYQARRGWGHSTWEMGCLIAERANVKQLILTHHEPERPDDDLARIERQAQAIFPATEAARENSVLFEAPAPPST